MHNVAVVAYPGLLLFDLATPLEIFGRVRLPDGRPAYRVDVVGTPGAIGAAGIQLTVPKGLDHLAFADTIIVPGVADPEAPVPEGLLTALRDAAASGTRIASICVGAFTLAAAGLLDGQRATTHWIATDIFRRRYPAVDLDPSVLFVDNGQILTSAGASAGIDLCLHMVRSDFGAAVAADAARSAVVALQREGGQAQYILARPVAESSTPLSELVSWMEENAHTDITLDQIADRAAVSVRTLNRRFHDYFGTTPMRWLTETRVRRAQELLETTGYPIDRVARQSGFPSTAYFRIQFKRATGVTPQTYRRSFRTHAAA
ncbi:GlxA family transcriptional regulator [uncultured Microbacterium sp.]|uniref:GlxA family transcriptional regulator n=1 Tax=uncultured Microbacterium sp. TaxID=191216 RepID=UPI0035CC4C95